MKIPYWIYIFTSIKAHMKSTISNFPLIFILWTVLMNYSYSLILHYFINFDNQKICRLPMIAIKYLFNYLIIVLSIQVEMWRSVSSGPGQNIETSTKLFLTTLNSWMFRYSSTCTDTTLYQGVVLPVFLDKPNFNVGKSWKIKERKDRQNVLEEPKC